MKILCDMLEGGAVGINHFQRKLFHFTKHLQTLGLLMYEQDNPDGASVLTLPYAFFFFPLMP